MNTITILKFIWKVVAFIVASVLFLAALLAVFPNLRDLGMPEIISYFSFKNKIVSIVLKIVLFALLVGITLDIRKLYSYLSSKRKKKLAISLPTPEKKLTTNKDIGEKIPETTQEDINVTAIGIEIIGGGRNKFTRTSVNVEGKNSKGIILNNTEDNEFEDVIVFTGNLLQKIRDMETAISKIKDDSINNKTKNTFKEDILGKLPNLTNSSEDKIKQSSLKEIRSTLADWITIQSALAPVLLPYLKLLEQLGS